MEGHTPICLTQNTQPSVTWFLTLVLEEDLSLLFLPIREQQQFIARPAQIRTVFVLLGGLHHNGRQAGLGRGSLNKGNRAGGPC